MTGAKANRSRLGAFVAGRLETAAGMGAAAASRFLERNADHIERQLRVLAAWAADDADGPPPCHLLGLGAFDLSDAADALRADAVRRTRGAGRA